MSHAFNVKLREVTNVHVLVEGSSDGRPPGTPAIQIGIREEMVLRDLLLAVSK